MRRDIALALNAYRDAAQRARAARHDRDELAHEHAEADDLDRDELADAERHATHTAALEHRAWLEALHAAAVGQDRTAKYLISTLAEEAEDDLRPLLLDGVARHGMTGRAA